MAYPEIRPVRVEGNTAYVTLTQGYEAMLDAADVPLILGRNWHARVELRKDGSPRVYAVSKRKLPDGSRLTILMHRVIAGTPEGMETDHRDGNGLDNRRSNLRDATKAQNARNRPPRADSASGIKGVHFDGRYKKWRSGIMVNGRHHHLGQFATKEDAASAYAEASLRLHGEFSPWVRKEAAPRLQDKIDCAVKDAAETVERIRGDGTDIHGQRD